MTLAISDSIIWNNVPGDLALLDARNGSYLGLNGTAADIWRAIDAGLSVETIAAQLAERHGSPHDIVAADVGAFIADALARGLIEDRRPPPVAPSAELA